MKKKSWKQEMKLNQHDRNLNSQIIDNVGQSEEVNMRIDTRSKVLLNVLSSSLTCFSSTLIISMLHLPKFDRLWSLLSTLIYICPEKPLNNNIKSPFLLCFTTFSIHLMHKRTESWERGNSYVFFFEVVVLFN